MRTFITAALMISANLTGCNVYHRTTCVTLATDPALAATWSVEIAVCYDEDAGKCYAFNLRNGSKDAFIGDVPCTDEGEPLVVSR
jgi:hypothetical protein